MATTGVRVCVCGGRKAEVLHQRTQFGSLKFQSFAALPQIPRNTIQPLRNEFTHTHTSADTPARTFRHKVSAQEYVVYAVKRHNPIKFHPKPSQPAERRMPCILYLLCISQPSACVLSVWCAVRVNVRAHAPRSIRCWAHVSCECVQHLATPPPFLGGVKQSVFSVFPCTRSAHPQLAFAPRRVRRARDRIGVHFRAGLGCLRSTLICGSWRERTPRERWKRWKRWRTLAMNVVAQMLARGRLRATRKLVATYGNRAQERRTCEHACFAAV